MSVARDIDTPVRSHAGRQSVQATLSSNFVSYIPKKYGRESKQSQHNHTSKAHLQYDPHLPSPGSSFPSLPPNAPGHEKWFCAFAQVLFSTYAALRSIWIS